MEDLLAAFAAAEDEAYTLFSYVNDVNAEIERLEDQISGARAEVQEAAEQVGAARPGRRLGGRHYVVCWVAVCALH